MSYKKFERITVTICFVLINLNFLVALLNAVFNYELIIYSILVSLLLGVFSISTIVIIKVKFPKYFTFDIFKHADKEEKRIFNEYLNKNLFIYISINTFSPFVVYTILNLWMLNDWFYNLSDPLSVFFNIQILFLININFIFFYLCTKYTKENYKKSSSEKE